MLSNHARGERKRVRSLHAIFDGLCLDDLPKDWFRLEWASKAEKTAGLTVQIVIEHRDRWMRSLLAPEAKQKNVIEARLLPLTRR